MGLFRKNVNKPIKKGIKNGDILYPIGFDGLSVFSDKVSKKRLLDYYLQIPELNTIINTKARMFAKINLELKNKKTELPAPLTEPIQKLLNRPNWYQSSKEFLTADKIFREVYGNNYIYMLKAIGFSKVSQLSTLNPYFLKLKEPRGGVPAFMRTGHKDGTHYNYEFEGRKIRIETEEVLHLNNSNTKDESEEGISLIEGIIPNLDNIKSAYESRGVILRSRGALGILTNNAKDQGGIVLGHDADEVDKLQENYKKYGLMQNQYQLLITGLNLRFQKMASSPKDLMLFEEIAADFQKLCDAYGFKSEMFSTENGSTFENAKQYEKSAYQNTIIPEAQEYVDGLNRALVGEDSPYIITGSFDDLHIFDEDKNSNATTLQLTTNALSQAYQDGAIGLKEYQIELKKYGIGNEE